MKKRLFNNPHKGFTITEIVVAAAVVSIILAFSFFSFRQYSEKAKKAEAVVTISNIRQAEEFNKQQTGHYVAAENTEAVNQTLNLAIVPKYYEYQVVGVTDDNFIVLARRIGSRIEDYLAADRLPPDDIVIAMDKAGAARRDYTPYLGKRPDEGSSGGGGTSGGSGGASGGSGTSGTSGGGIGAGSGTQGGDSGGSGDDTAAAEVTPYQPEYSAGVEEILEMLRGSTTGVYFAELILDKAISIVFEDFLSEYPDLSVGTLAFWAGTIDNTIHLYAGLSENACAEAIAATIIHEATHADYSYYPAKWIDSTLEQHPELTESDLHINRYPLNSIDQEYNCFKNSVLTWKEIKGTNVDWIVNAEETLYDQGEEFMKAHIRLSYADQMLPEY